MAITHCDKTLDLDAPLYTAAECEAEIKEIDALIRSVRAKPVGVGVPGAGNAHWIGRLADLRKERATWEARLKEARLYEAKCSGGVNRSRIQGPPQVIE